MTTEDKDENTIQVHQPYAMGDTGGFRLFHTANGDGGVVRTA